MSCLFCEQPNPVDIVHWHVRPRYDHSVEFFGMRFDDDAFGRHYDRGTQRAVPDAVKRAIAEEIMKHFSLQ